MCVRERERERESEIESESESEREETERQRERERERERDLLAGYCIDAAIAIHLLGENPEALLLLDLLLPYLSKLSNVRKTCVLHA